ncbi:MAG TPA: TVP38/TMEM64 family protein [Alphaproteobacteria bacterium]|nr:TVP38/TMEM64 family protein [Alphaproteobacteria bacterium]
MPEPSVKSSKALRFLPILLLGAGLVVFFALGLHRYASFSTLAEQRTALLDWVARLGPLAPVVFIGAYIAVVAFSLPGATILTLAGGFVFGTLWGGIYAVTGATIGAIAVFLAARTAFGDALRARAGSAIDRMEEGFRRDALSYLLVLRLIPIFPFFLVNLVPAFLGVALPTYVAATFFGIMPGTFVYASVGAGLGAVFDAGGEPDLGVIFSAPVLLPLIGLAVLALAPVAYRRFQARRA